MTGKHSPGYLAAYAAATREAARRFREDNPDEWEHILQRQQRARLDMLQRQIAVREANRKAEG